MNDRDQQHPQEKSDRLIVNELLRVEANPHNEHLAELARLRIRYQNFPGAREIQRDLDLLLSNWGFTEEELYETTRKLHATGQVYQPTSEEKDKQDWS